MRAEYLQQPMAVELFPLDCIAGDVVDVILRDGIEQVEMERGEETVEVWVCDEYHTSALYRQGLALSVEAAFDAWIEKAKGEAPQPTVPERTAALEAAQVETDLALAEVYELVIGG